MESENILRHVALIMDGNGRWARKRGLPRLFGHRAGIEALEKCVRAVAARNIPYMSVYAFSTENWNRPQEEVSGLMKLMKYYAEHKISELQKNGVRVRFAGSQKNIPGSIRKLMDYAEETTKDCTRLTLIVCFNYGGRKEIAEAAANVARAGEVISEETISSHMYLPDVPDPDLIIRTGGELRLSNFWLWQGAYSELYFSDTYWPDFDDGELDKALQSYAERERRYGRVK